MDADKMNEEIKAWSAGAIKDLQAEFDTLNIVHRPNSPSPRAARDSLKNTYGKDWGVINKVSFTFPQHMIYVAKGVGKGVPISLAGSSKTTRKPKDWFNQVIDNDIEDLADIVANEAADLIVNNLHIR